MRSRADRVSGVSSTELSFRLDQVGDRAIRGISQAIREGAHDIAEKARSNAPVDQGNLEDAIKVDISRSGVNGRVSATVYVDESMPAPELTPDGRIVKGTEYKVVGDYAMKMHEGEYKLGKRSRAKASAGHEVGPKYLERAVDEVLPGVVAAARRLAKRAVG